MMPRSYTYMPLGPGSFVQIWAPATWLPWPPTRPFVEAVARHLEPSECAVFFAGRPCVRWVREGVRPYPVEVQFGERTIRFEVLEEVWQ